MVPDTLHHTTHAILILVQIDLSYSDTRPLLIFN